MGNVFVTGTALGSVDFGGGTALTSTGAGGDVFVASFDGVERYDGRSSSVPPPKWAQ